MDVDSELERDVQWLLTHPKSQVRAYGHNFKFDPKVSPERLDSFKDAFSAPPPSHLMSEEERRGGHSILATHHFYHNRKIRRRIAEPETFGPSNGLASFRSFQENVWLVRLEVLTLPLKGSKTDYGRLASALEAGDSRTPEEYNYIAEFLRQWNESAPLTPQFAARETELREDLRSLNWLERLRIRLGLNHFKPDDDGSPLPVALMMYRASEVRARRRSTTSIAHHFVRPTVLDQRPSEHFFPAPPDMIGGRCMPLLPQPVDGARLFCEILHPKFDYRVENLVRLALVKSQPPNESLKGLRNAHLACLRRVGGDASFGEVMGDDVAD